MLELLNLGLPLHQQKVQVSQARFGRLRHPAYNMAVAHLRAIQAFYCEEILAFSTVTPSGSKAAVKPTTWSPESAKLKRHLFRRSIRVPATSTSPSNCNAPAQAAKALPMHQMEQALPPCFSR
ncbi:hypothetical protein Pfl01_2777 [Pseudomonas fluorescens Pf0-1]|uniref:Uncharacterized protein n=1 Tax=Pseudomonas fluorescens (strain Pf0-1) TaxID=205922 RepID=Q3KCI7_PSEPF|nr:hypothetical protein Pfl01_2777 [Pseudomonas fluorescens Pf0-1]